MVLKIGRINLLFEIFILNILLVSVLGDYNCEYKKDGFYSDDDFCHIYWRCNYGVAEEYECPAGTAWNHVEMRCDWLDNVDCSRIDESKKEDDDEPETTTKKSKKKTTTTADSDDTTTPVDEESTKKLVTNAPLKMKNTTTAEEDDDDDEDEGFDYNELCFNASSNDAFKDDPFVCNRYVRCNHGSAQRFVCTKSTAWDSVKKMCTWISEVNCGDRQLVLDDKLLDDDDDKKNTTKTTKTTKKTTKIKTTKLNTSTKKLADTTENIIENNLNEKPPSVPTSSICTNPGSYLVQDNTNCASYYMCNNGKESKMTCPDKQLFNSETNQCEDSQQVGCGTRPANLMDKTVCTSKRDGIYPDVDRGCRIFFQCVNQLKTREAACPSNLKFNSVSAKCENPANILAPCGTFTSSSIKVISNFKHLILSLILVSKFVFLNF